MAQVLDAAQIQQLLSQTKSRGEYDQVLREFLNSGEAGIEVDLDNGPLAGKRAKMVKVGFDNARKKTNENGAVHPGGKDVRVIAITGKVQDPENAEKEIDAPDNSNDHVYLINTALATGNTGNGEAEQAA